MNKALLSGLARYGQVDLASIQYDNLVFSAISHSMYWKERHGLNRNAKGNYAMCNRGIWTVMFTKTSLLPNSKIKVWISNYICINWGMLSLINFITYIQLGKLPLKLGHEWIIATQGKWLVGSQWFPLIYVFKRSSMRAVIMANV